MTAAPKKPSQKKIGFSIKKIESLEEKLSLTENFKIGGNESLTYNLGITFLVDSANSGFSITIRYEFFVNDVETLRLKVQTDFIIKQLDLLWKEEDLREKSFVLFLIEIAIGHTRGVQSRVIKDTPLDYFYIPVIQRDKLMEKLPNFKNSNSDKKEG